MRRSAVLVTVLFLSQGAWFGAGVARAKDALHVDESHGGLTLGVPVTVPAYHGLEPALSLSYDSAAGNGLVGTGWGLGGFSTIERAVPGRGAPRYDANDIFLLDGMELVPCAQAPTSPSCTTGGTHATKVESYRRIAYDGTADAWTVWQPNGTRQVFGPVFATASGTFRWGVQSVVDTASNTVAYAWWCDGTTPDVLDCYPTTVSYNGTVVTISWEQRPDELGFATGAARGTTRYRLVTVDVTVSGQRARAFALAYGQAAITGWSQLTSVQQYGRDATLDAGGLVTGGSSLPPLSNGYAPETLDFTASYKPITPARIVGMSYRTMADFTGDGRADVFVHDGPANDNNRLFRSNGDGTFTEVSQPIPNDISSGSSYVTYSGDFNGDGRADLFMRWTVAATDGTYKNRMFLNNGDGTSFTKIYDPIPRASLKAPKVMVLGDFNGDGKTDIFAHWGPTSDTNRVFISNGDGTFTETYKPIPDDISSGDSYTTYSGDFNGDGRADLLMRWGSGAAYKNRMFLNNGDGTSFTKMYDPITRASFQNPTSVSVADFDGDGKDDVFAHWGHGSGTNRLFLSRGETRALTGAPVFTEVTNPITTTLIQSSSAYLTRTGDFNGDGVTDVLQYWTVSGTNRIHLGKRGGGFVYAGQNVINPAWINADGAAANDVFVGDVAGRGRASVMVNRDSNGLNELALTLALPGGRLTAHTNTAGGTAAVSYTPSSAWANTNAPPVMATVSALTLGDGRDWSATTSYSYSGGLYDRLERRFLGFRYAQRTSPCLTGETQCPYQEAWFRQDYGALGMPERVDTRTGDGTLQLSTTHEFLSNGATVPYTSHEVGQWQYAYDGTGGTACPGVNCVRLFIDRCQTRDGTGVCTAAARDAYGNPTQEVLYGDYDVTGDEKTVVYGTRPNTSAYIVGLSAFVRTYAGVAGPAGALLGDSQTYYDGATTWDQAPSVGRATKGCSFAGGSSYVCAEAAYDSYGNRTRATDVLGNATTTAYDATYHNLPVSVTNALGHVSTTVHDAVCGVPTQAVDANGQVATMQYDALCRLTRADAPLGSYRTLSYANLGSATTQYVEERTPGSSGTGEVWARQYVDGLGRTYKHSRRGVSADVVQETEYDPRGNVARASAPYFEGETPSWTTPGYDGLDRVTRLTAADETFQSFSYGLGVMTVTDELGRQHREQKDIRGQVVARAEFVGEQWRTATYAYDVYGRVTRIQDPAGNAWTMGYDQLGRRTAASDPDAGASTFQYDAAGRLTRQVDAKSQAITFAYDALGRRTRKVSGAGTVSWTYDQARTGFFNKGKLTTLTDPAGTATFDYSAAGVLLKSGRSIDGTTYTSTRGYDAAGRLLWNTLPDGSTLGTPSDPFVYDAAGQLKTIPGFVTEALYDAAGRLTRQTNVNGTVTTRSYSATRGWLTALATVKGGTTLQNLGYTRNAAGQITQLTSPFAQEAWSYGYDAQGQLTTATNTTDGAQSQTFGYDVQGNVTTNSRLGAYTYAAAGQARPHAVVTAGANGYAYDASGNMVSGAGRTITWDAEHRPTNVSGTTFVYDGQGGRLKKVVGATTTRYLGDGYEVTGGVATKYVTLAGAMVGKQVGSTKYWHHTDHLGSVQAVTDASGAEVQRLKYRPYGERLATGTGHAESRGFTGQRQDETGLFYLHARYYDPVLARFVSPDPVASTTALVGLNRYAYANNDGVNHSDTNGMWSFNPFKAIASVFKAVVNVVKTVVKAVTTVVRTVVKYVGAVAKGVVNLVSAAVKGDIKAIATVAVVIVSAFAGGLAISAAVQSGGYTGLAAVAAASGTEAVKLGALYIGLNGAVAAGTSFAIGLIQTGSLREALRAAGHGFLSGLVQGSLNLGMGLALAAWDGKAASAQNVGGQQGANVGPIGKWFGEHADNSIREWRQDNWFGCSKSDFAANPLGLLHDKFMGWVENQSWAHGPGEYLELGALNVSYDLIKYTTAVGFVGLPGLAVQRALAAPFQPTAQDRAQGASSVIADGIDPMGALLFPYEMAR